MLDNDFHRLMIFGNPMSTKLSYFSLPWRNSFFFIKTINLWIATFIYSRGWRISTKQSVALQSFWPKESLFRWTISSSSNERYVWNNLTIRNFLKSFFFLKCFPRNRRKKVSLFILIFCGYWFSTIMVLKVSDAIEMISSSWNNTHVCVALKVSAVI